MVLLSALKTLHIKATFHELYIDSGGVGERNV